MFERFTDRARKVLALAKTEAVETNRECVGTQDILYGLLREGSGVAHHVLSMYDISLKKLRDETTKCVQEGDIAIENPPWTPRAKKVFEHAIDEAKLLGHTYVGTEHLLLGLLREKECVALQVLKNLEINTNDLRGKCLNILGEIRLSNCVTIDDNYNKLRELSLELCKKLQSPAMEYLNEDIQKAWSELYNFLEEK